MPTPSRFVADSLWLLLLALTLVCFTGCDKDELKALREANRIAEEARREQALQNVTFAALESTLSEERQAIDRERAQAAERHDEAAKERIEVLADRRKDLEAARRENAIANVIVAVAPLGIVGIVVWAVMRAVRLMMRPRPEDSTIVEYMLSPPHLKSVYWDPGLLERVKNLRLTDKEIEQAFKDAEANDKDTDEDESEPDSQGPEESQPK
jgi:hypothetical protein